MESFKSKEFISGEQDVTSIVSNKKERKVSGINVKYILYLYISASKSDAWKQKHTS